MKSFLNSIFILGLVFAFTACSQSEDEGVQPEKVVDERDQEDDQRDTDETEDEVEDEVEDEAEGKEVEELEAKIEELEGKIEELGSSDKAESSEENEVKVKTYGGTNYITLDSPKDEYGTHEEPVVFSGSVSPNTTKIVVSAVGGDPKCTDDFDGMCIGRYYEDVYRLQGFNYGDDSFVYRAKSKYGNLSYGTNDYEIKAYFDDGTTKIVNVTVYFIMAGAEMGKPVIYLYPEKVTKAFVNVEPTDGISVSEPALGDGWNVIATPSGKIYNIADRTFYPYLFWEGFATVFRTPEEGFVVAIDEVEGFFDEKLSMLGLNKTEIADFKEFWLPRLSEDPYYFITFVPQAEFDKYAPLTVKPEPDSIIRVFFDYKGLDKKVEVVEQKLETPVRDGFTVVEWGGRLYRQK